MPTAHERSISVIVPCFNARRWICATLRSVFAQDLQPAEVIVVDDGSSDGGAELLAAEFPQVRVLHQANAGVAAARNHGVRAASGDWVAFLDADDIWLPSKLRQQHLALQAAPGARLCYTAWRFWPCDDPEPSPELLQPAPATAGPSGWIYTELLLDCAVWTSTTLMDRRLFGDLGGFDETLRIGEDYDLWLRASRETPIIRVNQPLALYRQHPRSLTRGVPEQNWQALVVNRALARWGHRGPDGREADARAVSRSLARAWRNHANAQLQGGQWGLALTSNLRACGLVWNDAGTWQRALRKLFGAAARP